MTSRQMIFMPKYLISLTLAAGVDCVYACASVSMQLEPANTEALTTQKIRKAANTSQDISDMPS